jgi:hypothetical protein
MPAAGWRDWGKPRNLSVRVDSLQADIWNRDLRIRNNWPRLPNCFIDILLNTATTPKTSARDSIHICTKYVTDKLKFQKRIKISVWWITFWQCQFDPQPECTFEQEIHSLSCLKTSWECKKQKPGPPAPFVARAERSVKCWMLILRPLLLCGSVRVAFLLSLPRIGKRGLSFCIPKQNGLS